jgi:hypothetical protein
VSTGPLWGRTGSTWQSVVNIVMNLLVQYKASKLSDQLNGYYLL